ncbi:MAG: 3'-5' exoribonuclease YhaM family protein [Candidatus Helarchaeota archaeon]
MEKIKKELFVDEIKSNKLNETINTSFMLIFKDKRMTKNQKLYYYLKFRDKTGIIEGRIFSPEIGEPKVDFELLKLGDYYEINAFYDEYGLKVNKIKKLDISEIDEVDYVYEIKIDIECLYAEIVEKIQSIKNEYLKKLLDLFFNDKKFVENFKNCPSASVHHHNYIGGNLEHTLGVVKVAEVISSFYKLDRDLVITGAILHDIGKFYTYDYDIKTNVISENDTGKLLGHLILSFDMINDKIKEIENFPESLKIKINHLILSHHGKIEWGSPVDPLTPEAQCLHLADLSDSRVKKMIQLKEQE